MAARALADLVVVVHLAFILFVGLGALLAWRWPRLVWLHVPAAVYGLAIVTVGFDCPLTPLEKHLRRRAGEAGYEGGFVDRLPRGRRVPGRCDAAAAGSRRRSGGGRLRRADVAPTSPLDRPRHRPEQKLIRHLWERR